MSNDPHNSDCIYIQDSAFDLLQAKTVPKGHFTSALLVYTALCEIAADNCADVTPERDGKRFEATVSALSIICHQHTRIVRNRLKEFASLGLIEPIEIPGDNLQPFAVRMRTVTYVPAKGVAS